MRNSLALVASLTLSAGVARADDGPHDRPFIGILAGAMFPTDSAYDTTAPELGITGGYAFARGHLRTELGGFLTAGRSGERGVEIALDWTADIDGSGLYLGGGFGYDNLGVNYADENEVGWHFANFPENHNAVFAAAQVGWRVTRAASDPISIGLEGRLPLDGLGLSFLRFPSVLVSVRVDL